MVWQACALGLLWAAVTSAGAVNDVLPIAESTEYKGSYESYESPHPFHFGYEVLDEHGNKQQRQEHGDEHGNVKGSYGYTDAHGVYRYVNYVADHSGFRAVIKSNEPGMTNEDPAAVSLTVKTPPQHVLEQGYSSVGSYAEPKPYLKHKSTGSYLESYKPTYKETFSYAAAASRLNPFFHVPHPLPTMWKWPAVNILLPPWLPKATRF